jgi:zinc protease
VRPGVEVSAVESVIRTEAERVGREGITEAELAKAQTQIEAEVIFDRDSTDQIAASLSEAIAVASWEWYADYTAAIAAVTTDDVQRVARKYFVDDGLTVGTFLPKPGGAAPGESDEEGK